ncbi:MAG: uroporphyrinogen-III synthase [Acidobacteriota bacterium]
MKRTSVLVIRQNGRFSSILRSEGFRVVDLELIRTLPLEELGEVDEKISLINNYDGLFFTSQMAARVFGERLKTKWPDYAGKIFVLGERAKAVLETFGFDVVHQSSANTAAELIRSLESSEVAGKHFLFVRGEMSLRAIPEMLQGVAEIDEVIVYRTVDADLADADIETMQQRLDAGEFDTICFFSPSGVERFRKLFSLENASEIRVAAIGETTAGSADGMNVSFISRTTNAEDFARDLAKHIKNIE